MLLVVADDADKQRKSLWHHHIKYLIKKSSL